MRYQLYKLFNAFVRVIPIPILRRMLRTMREFPDIADRVGYTVYPQVFYNPFPEPQQVDLVKLKKKRNLPGVNFNMDETNRLMGEFLKSAAEIQGFIKNRPANTLKIWDDTYPVCDSAILYAMLRHLKPRNYIEVGCGWSSRCSAAALERNQLEGHPCNASFIEPYPPPHLIEVKLPGEFLKQKIEQTPLEFFLRLEAGDVLFIDTSHVIKTQNDVEYEFIQILPALKSGVIVHIHDICSPYDYPAEWLVGTGPNRGGNNEQYALECLLSGGGDWEVIFPVYLLWKDHRAKLAQLIDSERWPAAFWMRKLKTHQANG
ncbi:MAG TPA: class I SAM-dependent methyltransferase [Verrucomicrobiae bacterium]|jgi:hypothetical protein|nr:class I SAM-dependent methyltransferase [Verrucomicrobiae bacterium]